MTDTQKSEAVAINVQHLTKNFKLPHEQASGIKQLVINKVKGKRGYEIQHVLKDISFQINEGEFFGIVGRNGSGKSTLLKILAGIYSPEEGLVDVHGTLTPFIELGVGFNPELTGRENVFLNGALLGFNKKDMARMYDDIVSFAELEKFMDQKLKNYSSGMQVRLAFAIAVRAESSILLLDEVLAVGDADFQKKCFDYFRELKRRKQTVVFISHDMNAVKEYCDRALLLDKGKIVLEGKTEKVAQAYTRLFSKENKTTENLKSKRWGTKDALIKKINISVNDEQVVIDMDCIANSDIERPVFGLTIHNPIGLKIFESNTNWKEYKTKKYTKGQAFRVTWKIENIFTNGVHLVSPAIANTEATDFYDNWDEAAAFDINKTEVTTAASLPHSSVSVQ